MVFTADLVSLSLAFHSDRDRNCYKVHLPLIILCAASVATLNFNTKDCSLASGTWLKLDPDPGPGSTLWRMSSFTDADNRCSYEKPINVDMDKYDDDSHVSWDFDWTSKDTCAGQYLWTNEIDQYMWFPTPGCYTCQGEIRYLGRESVRDSKSVSDVKVLCNSGDYLSLLSKTGGNGHYTLIFLTTYPTKDFRKGIPSESGKYCTALLALVEILRKELQQDGVYESLPSACNGGAVIVPRIAAFTAMVLFGMYDFIW